MFLEDDSLPRTRLSLITLCLLSTLLALSGANKIKLLEIPINSAVASTIIFISISYLLVRLSYQIAKPVNTDGFGEVESSYRSFMARLKSYDEVPKALGHVDKRDSLDVRPVIQSLVHGGDELGAPPDI